MGYESALTGMKKRLLQWAARLAPGVTTLRVLFRRRRGVKIAKRPFGSATTPETSRPQFATWG